MSHFARRLPALGVPQQVTITLGEEGDEITASVLMTEPGDSGNSYGIPEDCYVGWAPEFDIDRKAGWLLNGEPAGEAAIVAAAGKPIGDIEDEIHEAAQSADWSDDE